MENSKTTEDNSGTTLDRVATLQSLKDIMTAFVHERDWEKYHTPRNLAASISVEAGELLELFQWLTPEEATAKSASDPAFRTAVGEELADVLMYLLSLANTLQIDVSSTVHRKMAKNRLKYPIAQFKGRYERPV